MPANTFLTNDIVTFEALDVLENTYNAMIHINSEYSNDFEFGGTVLGQTLTIRKPARYIGRLGQAADIEAITESFVPLTLSYQRGVDTQVSSQNLTLDIDNYRERVLKPQIVRVSNLIDQDVCNLAQGLNNFVGTPGTTPTTLTTYLAAKTKLDNLAAPMQDGTERSTTDVGRSFSVYTTASRHKPLVAVATVIGLSALFGVARAAAARNRVHSD